MSSLRLRSSLNSLSAFPQPLWRLWLVWLRVRPRLRDGHVVLASPAPARLARDGALQRPPGGGLGWQAGRIGLGPPPASARCGRRRPRPEAGGGDRHFREAGALARAWVRVPACVRQGAGIPRLRPGPVSGPWSPGSPGPGYLGEGRGKRRGPAILGTCASGKPMASTQGPVEMCTEGGLPGLNSERASSVGTPVAFPEEVSFLGRSCTDPFWCGSPFSGFGTCGVLVSLPADRSPSRLLKESWFSTFPFVGTLLYSTLLTFTVYAFLDGLLM